MDNYQIADTFSLLSKLMDIHGENSFKAKSYASAAFAIEKLPQQLSDTPKEKISSIKGIGASTAQKIIEMLENGRLKALDEIIIMTPPGIVEMLNIKGIGPKKINTIWKEMEIESIGELLYACQENRLKLYKGFGEKTQQNVIDVIEFYQKSKGSHLYAQVEMIVGQLDQILSELFPNNQVLLTGSFIRQLETINEIEFLIDNSRESIEQTMLSLEGFVLDARGEDHLIFGSSTGVKLKIYWATKDTFWKRFVQTSSPQSFLEHFNLTDTEKLYRTEQEVFEASNIPYIPAALRDLPGIIERFREDPGLEIIQVEDIRGIIHCHSNWSDGSNTIEELAQAAMAKGLEYLVISDHSKSAFYANGLQPDRILAQHDYIDALNAKLQPFQIFKSIEADILNDGSLDYPDDILRSFDMVIASVHSNLKMTEDKAMARILKAIENPYTTILGHMTGRLLLSREGYPVDHRKIIDACASNNVVIELNAHPNRLDIDWRHISYALEKNVMISIDPDSHFTDGLDDIKYGVLVAQKALVQPKHNLSSLALNAFREYISKRKNAIN